MEQAARQARRDEILDIAVALLAERGYRDASMIEVARRAAASKETLYAWFGDKRGLYEAAVRRNASDVQGVLARALEDPADLAPSLAAFGTALLDLLLGESAVAINRAAISEAPRDPTLAELLSRAGREATLPKLIELLERHADRGDLAIDDGTEAAEAFLGLLLGDCQIRRLLGRLPTQGKAWQRARADRATKSFLRLYGT